MLGLKIADLKEEDTLDLKAELKEAHVAAGVALDKCEQCNQNHDDAVMLEANLRAWIASRSTNKQAHDGIRSDLQFAQETLKNLKGASRPNALRVLGVIALCLDDFEEAIGLFQHAIKEFWARDQFWTSKWCAVAHWQLHLVLKRVGHESRWCLKQAVELSRAIEGKKTPYYQYYSNHLTISFIKTRQIMIKRINPKTGHSEEEEVAGWTVADYL